MIHRIEIATKKQDARAGTFKKRLHADGFTGVQEVWLTDVYTVEKELDDGALHRIADTLTNPVLQYSKINEPIAPKQFDYALEIGFLPGVTDNVAHTAKEIVEDLLKATFKENEKVSTSQVYYFTGAGLTKEQVEQFGLIKANTLIQRLNIKDFATFQKDGGMDRVMPKVKLEAVETMEVDLQLSDEKLIKLGKEGVEGSEGRRGPLALDLPSLHVIQDYYKKEGRKPTDVELESLAQTWSEHCKHTIFANPLDAIEDGLYKGLIKRATNEIRKQKGEKDFCVSVFTDNAGGIIFDDNWVVSDKAETHNSPSALDPFGGSITGIVGVNRDALGFGMGSKPVANRYGFCFSDPRKPSDLYRAKDQKNPTLHPRKIMDGVIAGVNAGGNQSGIPTPQGFMMFEDRYRGKPLVFVGTIGMIPKTLHGKPAWEKGAKPGDNVVMVGGRVGQDGIHGATFSSEAMDSGSPATAVQIGDPITQKKMSDAIVKEAREMDLYNSITDNGAGGLSCSVAEMAKECGGCEVELHKVPLKYPNLEPWKIWISESQERMTLAVPDEKLDAFMALMKKRGVEATVIGKFTDSGRCVVRYHDTMVMDMEMNFLHNGLPKKILESTYQKPVHAEPDFECPEDLTDVMTQMLSRPNITSHAFISRQYDHEVQAGSVIKPLQGKGEVNGEAAVVRPLLTSDKGVVISQGLHPTYSDIDTYHMAAASIDTAIRNAVSVGGDVDIMALMDNFCWCSSEDPQRLGELKAAVQACYDAATIYGTPFISGKDSMFNDFKGYDAENNPIKVSVPPTLLISSLSVIPDIRKSLSLDVKISGDLVYVLGTTKNELGASEYFAMRNTIGNSVPKVDVKNALELYRQFFQAVQNELFASAITVNLGGLGIAFAKMAIAGKLGMEVDLRGVKQEGIERDDGLLFSESQSRFVVTIDPKNQEAFEKHFGDFSSLVGKITDSPTFAIAGMSGNTIVKTDVNALHEAYHSTFLNY